MSCIKKIVADITIDCDNLGKTGLSGSAAILIAYDDINRLALTRSGSKVTAFALNTGARGVRLEWYKDLGSVQSAYAPNTEGMDGFTHSFLCRLPTTTSANADVANALKSDKYVIVYQTKFIGADGVEAFKIAGLENGLSLSEMAHDSTANGGATTFTLATSEGDYEQYPWYNLLLTDYATTKAAFDDAFTAE